MDRELAQVNVADAVDRLDSPRLAGFVDLLGPLDALARRSPGFVWRPDPATVDPADLMIFGDPWWMVVNLSVWTSVEALRDYVYGTAHRDAVRARRQWFPGRPGRARRCGGCRRASGRASPRPTTGSTCSDTAARPTRPSTSPGRPAPARSSSRPDPGGLTGAFGRGPYRGAGWRPGPG